MTLTGLRQAACAMTLCFSSVWPAPMAAAPSAPLVNQLEQVQQAIRTQQAIAEDIKAQTKDLQDRQKAQESAAMEAQRKSIDWWLTAIGLMLTVFGLVVAVGGVLLPIYWLRAERSRLKAAEAEFDRMKQTATVLLSNLAKHEKEGAKAAETARSTADEIQQLRAATENFLLPQNGDPESGPGEARQVKVATAAAALAMNPEATPVDALRARAIQASQKELRTESEELDTFDLWKALSLVAPSDANSTFNAGVAAQHLHFRGASPGRTYWLNVLSKFYSRAIAIKPNMHEAATNWGVAIAREAQVVNEGRDLTGARSLWRQAAAKFFQALTIKADSHEAAYNWGNALSAEALALNANKNLAEARELWAQAGERYAMALSIKADKHEAAFNWGLALAAEARAADEAGDFEGARASWRQAKQRYAQALALKADKYEAMNNWGCALADEARAVNRTNLPGARALWKEAGDRFAEALTTKSDYASAAFNWGIALATEAQALSLADDLPGARALWKQAGERFALVMTLKSDNEPSVAFNWGVALGHEAQALRRAGYLSDARATWAQAGHRYAQALAIKADLHEAANSWSTELLHEVQELVSAGMLSAVEECLARAARLLETQSALGATGRDLVAYNLACVYSLQNRAQDAVDQLEVSRVAGRLPDHWPTDADLASIRTTPEYLAWVQTHFPDSTDSST